MCIKQWLYIPQQYLRIEDIRPSKSWKKAFLCVKFSSHQCRNLYFKCRRYYKMNFKGKLLDGNNEKDIIK